MGLARKGDAGLVANRAVLPVRADGVTGRDPAAIDRGHDRPVRRGLEPLCRGGAQHAMAQTGQPLGQDGLGFVLRDHQRKGQRVAQAAEIGTQQHQVAVARN